jgi:hypothetical protein
VTSDAGLDEVYAVCPDVTDAGEPYELDGGTWVLPPPHGPRLACKLAGCEDYAAGIDRPVPLFSTEALVFGLVLALLVGVLSAYGGWSFARWVDGK